MDINIAPVVGEGQQRAVGTQTHQNQIDGYLAVVFDEAEAATELTRARRERRKKAEEVKDAEGDLEDLQRQLAKERDNYTQLTEKQQGYLQSDRARAESLEVSVNTSRKAVADLARQYRSKEVELAGDKDAGLVGLRGELGALEEKIEAAHKRLETYRRLNQHLPRFNDAILDVQRALLTACDSHSAIELEFTPVKEDDSDRLRSKYAGYCRQKWEFIASDLELSRNSWGWNLLTTRQVFEELRRRWNQSWSGLAKKWKR